MENLNFIEQKMKNREFVLDHIRKKNTEKNYKKEFGRNRIDRKRSMGKSR